MGFGADTFGHESVDALAFLLGYKCAPWLILQLMALGLRGMRYSNFLEIRSPLVLPGGACELGGGAL